MKEFLLKLFNNDILYQVLSLILTPVLGYLLVMYSKAKKKLIASLEEKTKEQDNKIENVEANFGHNQLVQKVDYSIRRTRNKVLNHQFSQFITQIQKW